MGRNGFGVEFRETDSTAPLSPYAQMLEGLADRIDDISVSSVKIAMEQARQLRDIEQTRVWALELANGLPGSDSRHSRKEMAERSVAAQIAATLHTSEAAARKQMWMAQCLANELGLTMSYLSDGAISIRHAQIMVDQVGILDPESLAMLELAVLPRGAQQSPPQFERSVRTMSERLNLEDIVERHATADEKRITYVEPMRDGMSRYVLEASAVQVIAIDNFVTARAKSLQVEGEVRTLTQLKADVASDLLLNVDGVALTTAGNGDGPVARFRSIRPKLLVTVPALTMLRRGSGRDTAGDEAPEQPGTLDGYGPIDPQTARELAANATSMIRILTDPDTGAALSIGRKSYRIPAALRLWLRYRDGRCRFPGCNRNGMFTEEDHGQEWHRDHGETADINLGGLCPGHHTLKTLEDWRPYQDPQGSGEIIWTSPTGHVYFTYPENDVDPSKH